MNSAYFGAATDIDINKYPQLTYAEAQATADTTTTSGTDVLLNAMTVTPVAGTYTVNFNSSFRCSGNGAIVYFTVYVGGVAIAHSERRAISYILGLVVGNQPNDVAVASNCLVTCNGSQAVEIRWRTTGGTATCHQRTFTILKVAQV